ncbi:hypothetical protein SAMN05421636_101487 [Pricia antarctica]|uniref:Sugar transporter n=1 Tax=Pricia antarctica TaxID=641691 RepID=A0A1G6X0D9_9FLAO|nr:hypothetical protein [Pricia antarctica]SDD71363.1 hypothetical protein SAMN05421636_101487 [Pricia antarctica]
MTTLIKPPKSFWVIAVLALLWNLIGVSQFFMATFMLDSMVANLPEVQADMYRSIPLWYTISFAITVFSGLLGGITMLLRKKITIALFGISLLAVLVAQGYWILGTDVMEVMGTSTVIMPLIVIVISIFLYFYNKGAAKNGWFK